MRLRNSLLYALLALFPISNQPAIFEKIAQENLGSIIPEFKNERTTFESSSEYVEAQFNKLLNLSCLDKRSAVFSLLIDYEKKS